MPEQDTHSVAGRADALIDGGDSHNAAGLSCDRESWTGPRGPIVVLRVAGEIDLLTHPTLQAALDAAVFAAVDQPPPVISWSISPASRSAAPGD